MYPTRSVGIRTWLAAGIGLAAVALLVALIAFALSPSPDQTSPAGALGTGPSPTSSASPSPAAPAPTGTPPSGSQSGNDSSSSGGDSGSGGGATSEPSPAPTGAPPSMPHPDVQAYVLSGALVADAYGHAYDLDGPDPSLQVARVEIAWGDGTTSTATLTEGGAFRDHHTYDPSYAGQSVTVRMVAYGHDGQTTTESLTVTLPSL